MTRCPTVLEISVWATPSAPVATEIAIIPTTSTLRSVVSRSGIARSNTSRSKNGETMPSAAENMIRSRTETSLYRYGRNRPRSRRRSRRGWFNVELRLEPAALGPELVAPGEEPQVQREQRGRRRRQEEQRERHACLGVAEEAVANESD